MIPQKKDRTLQVSGGQGSESFSIDERDAPHIMGILRSQLYSDRVLAVLREYASNAWDAHKEAGKTDVPFKVELPTYENPTLTIEDFGPGLSHEAVFEVYTRYGSSTKRSSNNAVGMLGIGSKSAFAYADSFTIISKHGGEVRTYVAVLDERDVGCIQLMHTDKCPEHETGVAIQVAVDRDDIPEFQDKAEDLFRFFKPQPIINTEIKPLAIEGLSKELKNGIFLEESFAGWVAVMGCVPYRINLEKILDSQSLNWGGNRYLRNISGVLFFDIGELQISASREELKYTDSTKDKLRERIDDLVSEYLVTTLKEIDDEATSPWNKRLLLRPFMRLGLPIPPTHQHLTDRTAKIQHKGSGYTSVPKKFSLSRGKQWKDEVYTIGVENDTRLILKDENRALKGYHVGYSDYVVRPEKGCTLDEAKKELDEILKYQDITGIPIEYLSNIQWTAPYKPPPHLSDVDPNKHKVKSFVLKKDRKVFSYPWSNNWESANRVPTDDDVFVILESFQSKGYAFFSLFDQDRDLAKPLGYVMPDVYGYKWTKNNPITDADCKGIDYREWRKTLPERLRTTRIERMLNYYCWSKAGKGEDDPLDTWRTAYLRGRLGNHHPIVRFIEENRKGAKVLRLLSYDTKEAIERLHGRISSPTDAQKEVDLLSETYPLLGRYGLFNLWDDNLKHWTDYIILIDKELNS